MDKTVRKKGAGRPSAEEAERKYGALLEAALEEFATKGFHGASLRAIATKADISTRTLYNRYPDKAALFDACLEQASADIQIELPDLAGTLAERLFAYAVAMQRQLSEERSRQLAMLIYRDGQQFEDVRNIARVQFERYQVDPVITLMRQHDETRDVPRDVAAQFVAMAFGEWQRRLLFGGLAMTADEIENHARVVVRIFLHGSIEKPN